MNKKFLNLFSRSELKVVSTFGRMKYNALKPLLKILKTLGIQANLLSYFGLTLIIGFAYFMQKNPKIAFFFLLAHVLIDGIDGPLAKYTKKDNKKGKVVDFVCDHTGLVIAVMMFVFNSMIGTINGIIYIIFYTTFLFVITTRNSRGKPPMIAARTKYPLYFIYGVWAFWNIDLINISVLIFNILMVPQIIIGSLVLLSRKGEKYIKPQK